MPLLQTIAVDLKPIVVIESSQPTHVLVIMHDIVQYIKTHYIDVMYMYMPKTLS